MNAAPTFTRLEDYRPLDFHIETIDLSVELDPVRTIVTNSMVVTRLPGRPDATPIRLDGRSLELVSIRLDGAVLSSDRYVLDSESLTLLGAPSSFILELVTAMSPSANQSGYGLFEIRGKLATQCESEGFRRITYFPDRPDLLARYRVTLTAEATRYPVLLSNGVPVASGSLQDGRHWVTWEDPFPKPSYIFAMVAGDFGVLSDKIVTTSGEDVAINIYADHEDIDKCTFAMDVLKRSLEWDQEAFGLEYDLPLYNVVALTGWAGAMENKGLNLHEAHGLVADPRTTTDDDYIIIERILGHEQFHNWTGNRVTCRDWFQLSLKEGLTRLRDQLFIAEKMGAGAWRIDSVKTLRRNQFSEDDGPAAHSIKPVIYAEVRNFYTATVYDKGAEVVRMFIALLGWETFRRGFDLYISRHDGQAVTTEEFVRAMEDASGRNLQQFRRWYSQGGRPRIAVQGVYEAEAQSYVLKLTQSCRTLNGAAAPEPFHIPVLVGLVSATGEPLEFRHAGQTANEAMLELTEAEQVYVFEGVKSAPIPSLLRGFSAPVSIAPHLTSQELAVLMASDTDPFARWDASQELGVALIRDLSRNPGAAPPESFIAAFEATLDDPGIDDLLKSLILTLPDQPVLSEGLAEIDLDRLMQARAALRKVLATRLRGKLLGAYHQRAETGPFSPDFDSISRRRLKNACLELLTALGDDEIDAICLHQVKTATNMTDQFEALSYLVHTVGPKREEALEFFYRQWRDTPSVLDKWFLAQALDRGPGGADRVLALGRHPDLTSDNIARSIAFYGSFFRQNRVSFHDPSGAGYAFLADRLLAADARGSASSLFFMAQINQWRRFDANRQSLMQAQLQRVAQTEGISKGLRENVLRALASS